MTKTNHGLSTPPQASPPCAIATPGITVCIYIVRYEWDDEKNWRNQRKHGGISFELATLVFEDARCLVYMDRIDAHTGEQRWIALGMARPVSACSSSC